MLYTFFMVAAFQLNSINFVPQVSIPIMKTLAQASLQSPAKVTGISESDLKPKLLEMGLYTGKTVTILFRAPFGDPIAVDVDGYVLSMRLNEASLVLIEEISGAE